MLISRFTRPGAGIFYQTDETPAAPGAGENGVTPTQAAPSQVEDEAYDKERALATIARLREESKDAKRLAKELAEFKAAEQQRKDKDLSDVERAEKRAAEAEDARKTLEEKYRTTAIDNAIKLEALAVGFADVDDAVKLVDRSAIDVGEDDKVVGAKEAVALLARAKPHLIKAASPVAPDMNATQSFVPSVITHSSLIDAKRQTGDYIPF